MQKHLFLTGPKGSASEAIYAALGSSILNAGGFVTRTERNGAGALLRCELLPAMAAGGAEGFTALPFLDLRQVPPLHDNEVFRGEGARLLREAVWYPFAVLDSLGAFELLIPQYREALADLLNADIPLVGTLLPRKEAEELCRQLGLSERVEMNIRRLWEALKQDPDTLIVEVSGLSRRRALRSLEQWVREYAG